MSCSFKQEAINMSMRNNSDKIDNILIFIPNISQMKYKHLSRLEEYHGMLHKERIEN